jgi:hypothetical protein
MKYLINSIKEIEEFITPSLEIDDVFNFFMFPKFEKQFRSCMRFYRFETFGEDYEKFPISFEEFNPKYDKFYGLNYNRLEEIIDFEEFNNDLKNCFIDSEDSYIREINEQIQNPSEAQFKIYLYNTLKNLKDSYELLSTTQIENNKILNLIKNELLDSYKRVYIKIKNEVPIYTDIYSVFKALDANTFVSGKSDNGGILVYIPSREEILKKLIDGSENRMKFESFERKLVDNSFLSIDFDQWRKSSTSLVKFYVFCENKKLFKSQYLMNKKGVKLFRQLYNFFEGESIDVPNKRKKIKSSEISKEYYFLK